MNMVTAAQDNYFLPRHKDESSRLNFQHKLLVDICGGNTIHESISKENITAIADVATGTGVWIQDAKSILTAHDPEKPRKYFAWDISDAQFSDPAARDGIIFSLHDGRQPFSEEFHNQFDLVHVRLLVAALKTPEYKQVVDNLVSLLKPGGYLQWEDLSMESYLHYHGNKEFADHPAMDTVKLCCEVQINAGAPGNVPQTIYEAAKSHPDLTDVVLNIYNTEDHPDKTEIIRQWISKTFDALLNSILLRSGRVATQEEANKEREKRREHLLDAFQKGYVPHGSMGMVLGRKVQQ